MSSSSKSAASKEETPIEDASNKQRYYVSDLGREVEADSGPEALEVAQALIEEEGKDNG